MSVRVKCVRILAATVAVVAAISCADPLGPPGADALVRDAMPLFQTDSLRYTIAKRSLWYEVTVTATFTNRTEADVFIENCHGGTSMHLEKHVAGRWQSIWSPVLLMCLSAPITIAPGETYRAKVIITSGFPGSNMYPQFSTTDLDGEYRLVWDQVLSTYQDKLPFGTPLPVESRRSNVFTLTVGGS